jgi:hypothetical protein
LEKHLHLQGRMLVSTYKSTRHYNPEEQHWHLHHRENLKSHAMKGLWKTTKWLGQGSQFFPKF